MRLSYLSSALLTWAGCSGTAAAFLSYGHISILPAFLYGAAAALLVLGLGRLSSRQRILALGLLALAGLLLAWHWRTGLSYSADALSYTFLDTFSDPYHLDLDKPFLADPALGGGDALTALLLALVWCFAAGAWHAVTRLVCAVLSLLVMLLGLYFAVEPPLYAVLLSTAYWASIPVLALRRRVPAAEGLSLLSVLFMGMLLLIAMPPSRYKEPDLLSSLSDTIIAWTDGSWFHGGSAFSAVMTGTEGRGRLGASDGLRYTGRQMIRISSIPEAHRLYIRSWIGSRYEDNQWKDLPDARYADVQSLFDHNQGAWYNQSAWLMEIAAQNPSIADALNGYLKDPPALASRRHFFSVPMVYEYTDQLFLPYDISFAADRLFRYDRAPETKDGKAYEAYQWAFPLSAAYALVREGQSGDPYWRAYQHMEADYRHFAYDAYTDVPDQVRAALSSQLAIPQVTTDEQKRQWIRTVQKYLSDYYTYTIRPGRTPENADFISYFLQEQKEGYCTYFASAGVMFLRAAGIPARYVTGVTVGPEEWAGGSRTPEGYVQMDVNDRHAHAWAEIYVDGIGWRPVEFTPGYTGSEDPIPTPPENRGKSDSPEPPQQPEKPKDTPQQPNAPQHNDQSQPDQSQQTPPKMPQQPQTVPAPAPGGTSLTGFLGLLLLLAAVLAGAFWYIRRRLQTIPHLLSRAETDQDVERIFAYLLRLTAWAGHDAPKDSYRLWALQCEKDPRFIGLSSFLALALKARFSGAPLSPAEREEALQLAAAMRVRCLTPLTGRAKWSFLLRSL